MSAQATDAGWPRLEIDGVQRLRAIAAGLPHVAIRERVFDAPFDVVWGFIGDLERSAPQFETGIARIEILERDGEHLSLETHGSFGMSLRFEVLLRSGLCLMHNRLGDVGMAAAPEGEDQTRFAHYEGTRWLGRLGRPLFSRKIEGDLDRIERLVQLE